MDNIYIIIYLLGVSAAFTLMLIKMGIICFVARLTNEHIYHKNLRKLSPEDKSTFINKASKLIYVLAIESAFSWLTVVVVSYQIFKIFFRLIRQLFISEPEAVKILYYPLFNNPNLAPEAVWAHQFAIQILQGSLDVTFHCLNDHLKERTNIPTFDIKAALDQLNKIKPIEEDVMKSVLGVLDYHFNDDDEVQYCFTDK